MSTSRHHAPDADRMRWACEHALQHYRRSDRSGVPSTILVDVVPHFVPGMGTSGEWYRVGAVHQVALDRYLGVYLDAVTGDIQLEQPMQAVVSDAQFAAAGHTGTLRLLRPDGDDAGRQYVKKDEGATDRRSGSPLMALPRRRSSQHGDAP